MNKVLRFEADNWASLARWVRRRPDVGPEGRAFAYRGPQLPLVLVFTAVSVLEVVAVDLIVPWTPGLLWLRILLLALGLWGVLIALGVLAGITVHPHVAGPDGLRARSGRGVDLRLPWTAVAGARRRLRSRNGGSVQVDGATLVLAVSSQTTVEITLREPLDIALRDRDPVRVTAVHLHADDADGLVAAVGNHARAARVAGA